MTEKLNVAIIGGGQAGLSVSYFTPRDGKADRKSTRLNSSHGYISYAVFCLKKKKNDSAQRRLVNNTRALDTSRGASSGPSASPTTALHDLTPYASIHLTLEDQRTVDTTLLH